MNLAWGAKVNAEFRGRVVEVADNIGVDPSWLMACMAFETGRTFSPSIRNPNSSATGLIQFMDATARTLGTTCEALAAMTAVEQLHWVERYFAPYAGAIHSLSDLYMAILWPAAVGKADDFKVFLEGSAAYRVNSGLDVDRDGAVTKGECAAKVGAMLAEGLRPGNCADTETQPAAPIIDAGRPYNPEQDAQRAAFVAPGGAQASTLQQPSTTTTREAPMPILALLSAFGPILGQLIPQIAKVVNPQGEVAQRNIAIAETVLNAVTKAADAPNVQAAVEKMQADPALTQQVTEAVITDPQIVGLLEVGGGFVAARAADVVVTQGEKPFWYSPVFWISLMLMPLIYIVTYRVLWAEGFSEEIRTVVITAIATGLLSSITGFYMGSAMGSARKDDAIANLSKK